ncbi:hypothetical protein OQA88_5739 [Cercophora sp. LCS_1]
MSFSFRSSRSPTPGPSTGWLLTSPVSFAKYSDDFDFDNNTQTNTPATSFSSTPPKIFSRVSSPADLSDSEEEYPDVLQYHPLKSTHCSKCGIYIHPTLPGATPLPCGHRNCRDCTNDAVLSAISKSFSVPGTNSFEKAECCPGQEIPLAAVGKATSFEEFCAYKQRLCEVSMDEDKRLYCHDVVCGMFIPPEMMRPKSGTCAMCEKRTCAKCGRRAHMFPCGKGTGFVRPGRPGRGVTMMELD